MSSSLPTDGDTVNDRYRIIELLGKGGGGQVFRAYDAWQSREVALKYLLNPTNKPNALSRFQDEFFKLKQFPHPNIGAGYDFELDRARNLHFFTTELIPGQNLFEATETLSPLETEELIVQVLRAIMFLHNNRFNHFDIKPPNVLVTQDSQGKRIAKLIDFGVSDFGFTGKLVGTASYMAPEMTTRDFPDHRADLYSLGVMWFHVLARHNPYRGENVEDSKKRHWDPRLPDLCSYKPDVCQKMHYISSILEKLLQIDREDRFKSAEAVIQEINQHKEKTHQYEIETIETRQSYLPTQSKFIGRQDIIAGVRKILKAHQFDETNPESSSGPDILLISGESGFGKTRLLEHICQLAQPNGFATYGANTNDPAALDRLRDQMNEAIDDPSKPILIWIDDYVQSAISDDVMKLRDHLLRWRALSTKPLRTCLIISGVNIKDFQSQQRTEVHLEPFTASEMDDYVKAVTGFVTPPRGFVEELRRYTEGRPGLVTSLMGALLNQGYLLDKVGRWKATTFEDLGVDFATIQIPEDLVSTIEQEYSRLDRDEIKTLEATVAWRKPTSLQNIELLLGKPIPPQILKDLVLQGWMSSSGGDLGVINPVRRSIVTRHANPQQLSKWYDQIVVMLKANPDADFEDIFWYESYGSDPKKALESKWELAKHYAATYRYILAVQVLDEMHTHGLKSFEFDAGILHAQALRQLHQYRQAMDILKKLENEINDPVQLAKLLEELTITALRLKDDDQAERYCMNGLNVARNQVKDDVLRIRFDNWLGHVFLERDNKELDRAISLFRRTFDEARDLPPNIRTHTTNNDLCKALYKKGLYQDVLSYADSAMRLCEDAGDIGRLLKINYYKCESLRLMGNYEDAEKQCKSMEGIVRKYPDRENLFRYYQGLGNIYSGAQRHADALLQYEHAMDVGGRLDDPTQAFVVTINTGIEHNECAKDPSLALDLVKQQKHQKEAERILLSALDYLHTNLETWPERPYYLCRMQLELGDLYCRMKQFGRSHQYLDDAEKSANHSTTKQFLFWIRLTRGEVCVSEGKRDAAEQIFDSLKPSGEAEARALEATKAQ